MKVRNQDLLPLLILCVARLVVLYEKALFRPVVFNVAGGAE